MSVCVVRFSKRSLRGGLARLFAGAFATSAGNGANTPRLKQDCNVIADRPASYPGTCNAFVARDSPLGQEWQPTHRNGTVRLIWSGGFQTWGPLSGCQTETQLLPEVYSCWPHQSCLFGQVQPQWRVACQFFG